MGILILLIMGTVAFFKSDIGNLQTLFEQMQRIITDARAKLPLWIVDSLPGNVDDLKSLATVWLDEHSKELQHTGKEAMHLLVHLLFGMVIGALISLHEGQPISYMRPLAAALTERAIRFGDAFRRIVFAQVRISALNTVFTGIFLQLILPLFGVHFTFGEDAYCPDVFNRTPSSHRQPDLEYSDYHCRPVALNLRSGLCTGLSGDHS
jgi:predicted PurR-regulated permease PerM